MHLRKNDSGDLQLLIFLFTLLPISTLISQERTVLDVWWEVEHPTTLAPGQTLAQKIDVILNSEKSAYIKAVWMEEVLHARAQEKDSDSLEIMADPTLVEKFIERHCVLKEDIDEQIGIALTLHTPGMQLWLGDRIKKDKKYFIVASEKLSPLSWYDHNNEEIVFLIQAGALVNHQFKYNWANPGGTALMAAARAGALKNFHTILAAQPDVLITDSHGLGAIDHANDQYSQISLDKDRKEIIRSLQILTMKALAKQPSLYWSVLPKDICSMLLSYICKSNSES